MGLLEVKNYFKKYGIDNRIIETNENTATVLDAANALGCTEGEIAKSLSFIVNDEPILIIVAGNYKIDNSKYKACFNQKASMINIDDVERLIGHKVGGVCPFAIRENVKVYLDVSLKTHDFVYPACGTDNSAIKLSIEELEKYSNYLSWIDVCKLI